MRKTFLLFFISLMAFCQNVWADSPLTSTDFSKAYKDHNVVQQAMNAKGILNNDLCAFLCDENQTIDVKVSIINALSWKFEGKSNAQFFFNYLKKKKKYSSTEKFLKRGSDAELICYAYLKALDNYFDVKEAQKFSSKAAKNSNSFTVHLIHSLISAQLEMEGNWCKIYRYPRNVMENKTLKPDFSKEAMDIILEYTDLYKEYCKN